MGRMLQSLLRIVVLAVFALLIAWDKVTGGAKRSIRSFVLIIILISATLITGCSGGGGATGGSTGGPAPTTTPSDATYTVIGTFPNLYVEAEIEKGMVEIALDFISSSAEAAESDFYFINAIDSRDENNILCFTGKGKQLKTTDGGKNWLEEKKFPNTNLLSVLYDVGSGKHTLVGGNDNDLMVESPDNGVSWNGVAKDPAGLGSIGWCREVKKGKSNTYVITNNGIAEKRPSDSGFFLTKRSRNCLSANPYWAGSTCIEEIGDTPGQSTDGYFIVGNINGEILCCWDDLVAGNVAGGGEKFKNLVTITDGGSPIIVTALWLDQQAMEIYVGSRSGIYKISKTYSDKTWYDITNNLVVTKLVESKYNINRIVAKVVGAKLNIIAFGYYMGSSQPVGVALRSENRGQFVEEIVGTGEYVTNGSITDNGDLITVTKDKAIKRNKKL
jgi:hypothetical protein